MKGEYLGIVGAIDKAQKSLSSLNPSADAARSLASLRGELGAYTRQQNEAQNKYNQLLEEGYKKNTKIVIQQKALLDNLKAENEVRRENIRLQEKAVEMSEKARVSAANQAQYYQDFDRSNNAGRYDNAARQQSEDRIRQQERAAQRRQQQADQMYAELQQRFQAMGAQTQGYRVNPSGTARSPVESYAAQSPGFEQYYPGATGYFENKKQAESRMRKARQAAASADAKFVADLDADIRAKAEFAGSVYVQLGAHAPLASFAGTAELQAQLNRHRLAFLESIENDLRDADKIYQEGRLNSKIRAAKDFTGGTQTEGTIKESIAQREAAIAGYNRRINTTSRDNSPEGQRELERLYKERTAQERLLQNDREILPKQASADAARKESEQASSRAFDAGVSRSGSRTAQALDLLQNRGLSPTPSGRRGITFGSSFGAQGRKIFDSEGGEFLEPQSLPPAAGVQFSLSEIQSGNLLLQRNELEVEKTRLRRFDQLRSFRGLTKPTEVIEQIKKQVSGIVDRKKLLAEAEENFFRAAGDPEAQKRIETEAQKIGDEIDGLRKALQDGANKVKSLKTSGRKGDERARLPQAVRLAKAQKEIFFLSPEQREDEEGSIKEIAERFRLNETLKDRQGNDIAGAGQAADRLRRGRFFEAARLANPESLVQLGFAGAFGGIPSLIGGAIGGASPLGPSGALLGSTLSQAVGQILFEKPIEAIKSVAEEIKESGLSLQRSILGITAIRQENVEVLGAGGKALGATQALDINQEKAREIQFAARAKLLPLGIGGQTEATFVQGVTSALSQRGLNANAQQTARIAELFGGAIQSQRPSLLENSQQLLKDLQDVLGGGPSASRTVLSQIVRPALPDIQKAGSA
jgi:hypothetical protein